MSESFSRYVEGYFILWRRKIIDKRRCFQMHLFIGTSFAMQWYLLCHFKNCLHIFGAKMNESCIRNSQNGNISTFYLDIYLVSSTTSYEIRNRKWNSQIDDLYYRIKNVNDDMYCALRIRENMYVGDSSKCIMVDDLDCQIIAIKVLSFLVFSLNWGNNYVKKEVTWSCLPFLN